MLSPAEVKELVPFINEEVIMGGFHCPTVSVVDSLDTGTLFRNEAMEKGVLQVFANTEVEDVETTDAPNGQKKISAVVTDRGRIEADYVVVACGVWSNRVANMAGATILLCLQFTRWPTSARWTSLAETNNEIGYPIVRDMDTFCYERQSSGSMEVGSYGHRAILHHPDDIPSNEEAALTPTEMPFTPDDFDDQMETAIELMDFLGDAEIKYAINGLLSLTPDAMPCLGETVEVRNLWSAAAVWVKEGPGMAQVVAEWMTYGYPRVIDPHASDLARFYPEERGDDHIWAPCRRALHQDLRHRAPPRAVGGSTRSRQEPVLQPPRSTGRHVLQARVWERAQWYTSNADLVDRYGLEEREVEWDNRWWSPIINGEHLNMRENAGLFDLSAFQVFELSGRAACDFAEYLAVNKVCKGVGTSAYTPWLNEDGGFHSDLTMMQTGEDTVRIVTGAFDGGRDEYWIKKYLPEDESVTFTNLSRSTTTLGLWGPNAHAILSSLTDADLSYEGSPYGSVLNIEVAGIECTLFRVSYVGDTGWEIYTGWDNGPALWDAIMEAGGDHGLRPVGMGVYAGNGSHREGYRLMGAELESEYNPIEAGLARPKVKAADFMAKRLTSPPVNLATPRLTVSPSPSMTTPTARVASVGCRVATSQSSPSMASVLRQHGRVSRVTTAGYGTKRWQEPAARLRAVEVRSAWHSAEGHVHERAVPMHRRGYRFGIRPREQPPEGLTLTK